MSLDCKGDYDVMSFKHSFPHYCDIFTIIEQILSLKLYNMSVITNSEIQARMYIFLV